MKKRLFLGVGIAVLLVLLAVFYFTNKNMTGNVVSSDVKSVQEKANPGGSAIQGNNGLVQTKNDCNSKRISISSVDNVNGLVTLNYYVYSGQSNIIVGLQNGNSGRTCSVLKTSCTLAQQEALFCTSITDCNYPAVEGNTKSFVHVMDLNCRNVHDKYELKYSKEDYNLLTNYKTYNEQTKKNMAARRNKVEMIQSARNYGMGAK